MRPEKISLVGEIRDRIEQSPFVILADYQGLTVEKISLLRNLLEEHNGSIHVVKNTVLGVIGRDMGWDLSGLSGPTAMIVGEGDITQIAKVLKKFAAENKLPVMKLGRLGETALSSDDVVALASLPSREMLIAQVVGTIAAPLTSLVGVMNQKVLTLLYVLKAVEEAKSSKAA